MKPVTFCTIEGCDKKSFGKGMCNMHYSRMRRHGTTGPSKVIRGDREAAFWAKVDKSGECWEWTGAKSAQGYGLFHMKDGHGRAHTYSLEMATGERYKPGMDTCHTCDNPSCVRPEHLYFGTRSQNIRDAVDRGQMKIGERHPFAKLTELDVVALREEYAAGASVGELENAYGLAVSTIRGIVLGYKWKSVGGPITVRRGRVTSNKKAA